MILRQAAPLQASPFGIELLPANHARLRLELVQLMPTGPPSASFVTSVTHCNFARPWPKGAPTWKPMKSWEGASSTRPQKYSSGGRKWFGIGLAWMYCVASVGATLGQTIFSALPFVVSHGKRNRLPAL